MRNVRQVGLGMMVAMLVGSATSAGAESAKGTIVYKGNTVTVQHAYLVKGPDAVDEKKIIKRIVLATKDLKAKLDACKAMSCSDGDLGEGMTIDLDGGPRVNYWVVCKDQMVQYSGTADPATFKTTADDASKIAGSFVVDASGAGGAKIDVTFDATLVKELTSAR